MNPIRELWLRQKARRIADDYMVVDIPDGWYAETRYLLGALDRLARYGQTPSGFRILAISEMRGLLMLRMCAAEDPDDPVGAAITAARARMRGVCCACGILDVDAADDPKQKPAMPWCRKHCTNEARQTALLTIASQDLADAERQISQGADRALVEATVQHRAWMAGLDRRGARHG